MESMQRPSTIEAVIGVLQQHAAGAGLTVPEVRALHPARSVRRTAVVRALRTLEELQLVRWTQRRVRWVGPLSRRLRPFGERVERIDRYGRQTPQERVEAMAALSAELLPRRGTGPP